MLKAQVYKFLEVLPFLPLQNAKYQQHQKFKLAKLSTVWFASVQPNSCNIKQSPDKAALEGQFFK